VRSTGLRSRFGSRVELFFLFEISRDRPGDAVSRPIRAGRRAGRMRGDVAARVQAGIGRTGWACSARTGLERSDSLFQREEPSHIPGLVVRQSG